MNGVSQLSQQLSQLSETLKSTTTLITRLASLSFQPGSEPLESESSVRVELAQDIHDSLKQLEEDLDLLRQDAEDLAGGNQGSTYGRRRESTDKDRERARLSAQITRLDEDLKTARSNFRKAQLSAKKASTAAKQKEREIIFATLQSPPAQSDIQVDGTSPTGRTTLAQQQKKNLTKDELEVDASSSVTAALRRTHALLSTELSRSRFAQETFDQSTAALADLGEDYSNLDTILSNSRNLLGTLLRSQKSDTWYLETAFYILITTLSWLIFRRILLGPFIRLPLFFLNWFLYKPLLLFLSVTGVLTTEPASRNSITKSRPPLIVQRSATDGVPTINSNFMPSGGVPAGAGGAQAKYGKGEHRYPLSEEVGRMADESAKQQDYGKEEETKRGDGEVLKERGDVPRNPKKKVFDAEVEDAKYEAEQREKQHADEQSKGGERDEL